jgi:hypothetical protein
MGNVKSSLKPGKNGKEADLVLLANGSSGPWEIAIDESTGKRARLFAHVEGPALYLYFEIPSRKTIRSAVHFLEQGNVSSRSMSGNGVSKGSSVRIGGFGRSSIRLVWDTEFADRCFLIVGVSSKPSLQFTLAGGEIKHLLNALRQVQNELA